MELLGDPPGAKMIEDAILDASGALFGGLLERILAPSCGQDGAKLRNLAPRWAQDGHLRSQMSYLRPFWEVSCPLLKILGAKSQIAENLKKTYNF